MPNRPHGAHDCDEDCRGCAQCYRETGDGACNWLCPHAAEHHEELGDAHDGECSCYDCRVERAADTAMEVER